MKAKGFCVKNRKLNSRHMKLSLNKAKREHRGVKVSDAGILAKAGKMLGVKVA